MLPDSAALRCVAPTSHFSEADLLGNIGFMEACIFAVVVGALVVWPAWRIVGKTGYPSVLGLAAFVPLLNIVLVLFLAFSEWPVERQLRDLERRNASLGT